jgi:putative membrane protein
MRGLVIRWCISAISLLLTAALLPGIKVQGIFPAFVAAGFWGILNALIRPVLLILTLPINILTLGLFTLIINGFMLFLVAQIIKGVEVLGFWWAVLGALILGIISWGLNSFINERGEMEIIDLRRGRDGSWHL